MTRARRVALVLGLPVVLAFTGAVAFNAIALADQVTYHVHRDFAAGKGTVRVSADSADASYRPGPGGRISVTGTLRGSLARPTFTWRATPGSLALHTQCRVPTGDCTEGFDITLPGGRPVRLSDSSGDLHASGFRGQVTLSDGSGDIGASRLSGVISLADGSGDISASGLTGPSLRLSNGSGDINVTGLAVADVTGKERSGDLTLTFSKVPRRVDITGGSGDIAIVLPPGTTRYQVQASSESGNTSISVPRGTSSAHVIIVSDGSGDITVR
jgi:hypothetical protein